jgi:hypothetical protein
VFEETHWSHCTEEKEEKKRKDTQTQRKREERERERERFEILGVVEEASYLERKREI